METQKTMANQRIQLTEQDLHVLVEDAVRIYLKEQRIDEFWGGLKNMMGAAGNAMSNMYQQGKQTWQTGEIRTKMQKLNNLDKQLEQQQNQIAIQRDNIKKQIMNLQTSIGNSQNKINQNTQNLQNRRGGIVGAGNLSQNQGNV